MDTEESISFMDARITFMGVLLVSSLRSDNAAVLTLRFEESVVRDLTTRVAKSLPGTKAILLRVNRLKVVLTEGVVIHHNC